MTLTNADWASVAEDLHAQATPEVWEHLHPRFNVAPTQPHPVVAAATKGGFALVMATWGFPGKSAGPLVINARAETVPFKPLFREAFVNRRCVVVADGFLEWRKTPLGRQPLWFRRKGKGLLYFAGLLHKPSTAESTPQFVVLTTNPNHLVAPVHDRMPAVLTPNDARRWLAEASLDVIKPAPDAYLTATAVSSRVNNSANDDPDCLTERLDTREQLLLF